jgi:hypothetical protein
MILYTPLSQEEIFYNEEEAKVKRTVVSHEGKMFYVDKYSNGEYRLAQLLSSNPNDYLSESFRPGSLLD